MPEPLRGALTGTDVPNPWQARVLPRAFYDRPVLAVARELIGKVLVHDAPEGLAAARIVETEAYRGPDDLAAHSARGRRTRRNEPMWGPPGHAYLFQLYGVHWAFNAVTGKPGEPHAVLIRAIEPLPPVELMCARRGMAAGRRELGNGPGKVCAALGVDGRHDGADLCEGVALFIAGGVDCAAPIAGRRRTTRIGRSPRIHVDYAGAWAGRPWRFYERGNRNVSVAPRD